MEVYLSGLEIATKRSNAINKSMEYSMNANEWMKNRWAKQASRLISLELNKYIPSIVGMVDIDKPRNESSKVPAPAQYIMSAVNDTKFNSVMFLVTGILGLEDIHLWISIPFCFMYVISIVGNSVILFFIKTDPSLHEPMYIFLSMLAVTDLGLSITTIPTILGIYLFNSRGISLDACFAQMFFIHSLSKIESSVLLLMAFDLFIA
ncbi:unnamed protein product [Caretta caretta]